MEECILRERECYSSTSTRSIARTTRVNKSAVWKIPHEERLFPYHLRRKQVLKAANNPRRVRFLQLVFTTEYIHSQLLCTISMSLTHMVCVRMMLFTSGSLLMCMGIVNDFLISPYLLPKRLNSRTHLIFLKPLLPELLDRVPVAVPNTIWFQYDVAPIHYCSNVRNYLNAAFGPRRIGRGGAVAWPVGSADLPSIVFSYGVI